MKARRHLTGKPAAAPVPAGRANCRHQVRPVRPWAAQQQQQPPPQQQVAAPELRRVAHSANWHGHERPDEYHWLDRRGPTDAELLGHLRAESQHTISQLAHTRQLQLELQAGLNAWLMAAALQPWQPSEQPEPRGVSQQQREHAPVAPDWLAGSGVLQYQQRQSFCSRGRNGSSSSDDSSNTTPQAQGLEVGGFVFFSQQHAAAPASHYRAPTASFAVAAACGVLPCDAVLLWSEAAAPGSSSSSSSRDRAVTPRWQRPANAVHSLAVSPCGSFLAVTFTCSGSSSSSSSSSSSDAAAGGGGGCLLAVIDCSSGELLLLPVQGVGGPVQWVQQPQQPQQQQAGGQQCVMYVAGRARQVHCLRLPTPHGTAAAAAATAAAGSAEAAAAAACGRGAVLPAPQPVVVYSDPLRVSLSIAEAGGMSFIVVFAADGLPRRVMFCSSSSCSGGRPVPPDDPAAWRSLLPAVVAADEAAADEADGDPTVRLAVTPHGRLLFARYSSAAQPQGLVCVAQLPQLGQQELAWQRLPLLLQPGQQLEAVFVSAAAGGRQQAGLQLLALVSQQQQQQPGAECGNSFVSQALSAHCYSLTPPTDAQQQQEQQRDGLPWLQLQVQSICRLPMPEPYFELLKAAWWPGPGAQLQLTFSSLVRPASVMTAELEQLAALQQQQDQRPAPAAGAARESAVHLRQLQPAPAAFDQAAYAALQFAVPSSPSPPSAASAGCEPVAVPVSLAFGREAALQLPACFQQASNLQTQEVDAGGRSSSTPAGRLQPAGPPLLLCCYGSYGIRESVGFSAELLQLLDCGWVVAVAHVRGGGWLGRSWAEAGRGLGKRCSVQDLLAVAQQLQQAGLCAAGRLAVQGSSAGAWLAASAMLQQPQLFAAAVLSVPCLDPLGLLLEQQHGWLELGDAAVDAQVYQSMRSWAPYDLLEQLWHHQRPASHCASASQPVQAGCATQPPPLPHVLLRAALHDNEVPISDPLKALARMRRHNQQLQQDERRRLLLRVVPGGHAAYSRLLLPQDVREAALKLAFLLSAS